MMLPKRQVKPLDYKEWLGCVAAGFGTCLISWITRFISRNMHYFNSCDILAVRKPVVLQAHGFKRSASGRIVPDHGVAGGGALKTSASLKASASLRGGVGTPRASRLSTARTASGQIKAPITPRMSMGEGGGSPIFGGSKVAPEPAWMTEKAPAAPAPATWRKDDALPPAPADSWEGKVKDGASPI